MGCGEVDQALDASKQLSTACGIWLAGLSCKRNGSFHEALCYRAGPDQGRLGGSFKGRGTTLTIWNGESVGQSLGPSF